MVFDGNFYWQAQLEDLIDRLEFRHFGFTWQAPLAVGIETDNRRRQPLGEASGREVYAKSTTFEWGVGIDASGPWEATMAEIRSHFPRTPGP